MVKEKKRKQNKTTDKQIWSINKWRRNRSKNFEVYTNKKKTKKAQSTS